MTVPGGVVDEPGLPVLLVPFLLLWCLETVTPTATPTMIMPRMPRSEPRTYSPCSTMWALFNAKSKRMTYDPPGAPLTGLLFLKPGALAHIGSAVAAVYVGVFSTRHERIARDRFVQRDWRMAL